MAKLVKTIFKESSFNCLRNLSDAENLNELLEMTCAAAVVAMCIAYLQIA